MAFLYVLGHSSLAYLTVKLVYRISNKELDPKLILFAIFFSNLIDLFHFDYYRMISHSLVGTLFIGCFVIFIFRTIKLIENSEITILFIATLTHIPADFFFSTYHFLYPIDSTPFSIFRFNSFEDVMMEIVLGVLFVLIVWLSSDIKKIKTYISASLENILNNLKTRNVVNENYMLIFLYFGFLLFSLAQFYFFIILNRLLFSILTMHIIFFSLVWISFFLILIFPMIPVKESKEAFKM